MILGKNSYKYIFSVCFGAVSLSNTLLRMHESIGLDRS